MEMDFKDRTEGSNILIQVLKQHFWDESQSLYHVETGYETHIPEDIRKALRYVYNKTTRHLRFAPDFLVVQRQKPDNIYYLEYKCTQTPLYKSDRINKIVEGYDKPLDWQDIGQCEREAFDNYKDLNSIGVRVAVLNYVAYHKRPLLCDFIENIVELHRDTVRTPTQAGSKTPFVNFDATSMRTLQEFLAETHGISSDKVIPYFERALSELRQQLRVKHHPKSPLYEG